MGLCVNTCMHVSVISVCACVCCVCMYKTFVYACTLIFDSLLYKLNKISKVAKLAWPGNDLPLFCSNQSNQAKLSGVVNDELKEIYVPQKILIRIQFVSTSVIPCMSADVL